jgi:hypothetical protein
VTVCGELALAPTNAPRDGSQTENQKDDENESKRANKQKRRSQLRQSVEHQLMRRRSGFSGYRNLQLGVKRAWPVPQALQVTNMNQH